MLPVRSLCKRRRVARPYVRRRRQVAPATSRTSSPASAGMREDPVEAREPELPEAWPELVGWLLAGAGHHGFAGTPAHGFGIVTETRRQRVHDHRSVPRVRVCLEAGLSAVRRSDARPGVTGDLCDEQRVGCCRRRRAFRCMSAALSPPAVAMSSASRRCRYCRRSSWSAVRSSCASAMSPFVVLPKNPLSVNVFPTTRSPNSSYRQHGLGLRAAGARRTAVGERHEDRLPRRRCARTGCP